MRMMFAVGSLNRVRSKIVVAGRLRELEAGSRRASGGPLVPPSDSLATPNRPVQDGNRRPGADRVRGGRDPIAQGFGSVRDRERSHRIH